MKKFAFTLLAGLSLAASAQAGEDYSAKAPVAPAPAPALWTWFAGGSVGYLTDMDTEMYTLHVGMERQIDDVSSHAIFLEVGYANPDGYGFGTKGGSADTRFDVDADIIPVTINYKYERSITDKLDWYIGAGVGLAFVDTDHSYKNHNSWSDVKNNISDAEFYGQIFTGLVYNVSDEFEIFGGARYIYMNDDDDFNTYGDDWMFELGARWNF